MTRLFVYGTLKRGCKNHHLLAAQSFVAEARTAPGYRLHDLGDFPGMVADSTDTVGVTGEVWSVDATTLAQLDAFEGVSEGLYYRLPVSLDPSYATETVHTYIYARSLHGHPALGPTWTET